MTDSPARGNATVSLGEMRRGQMAVSAATILVHARPDLCAKDGHKRISLEFASPTAACAIAKGQVAYYQLLEQQGHLTLLGSADALKSHWRQWAEHTPGA